MFTYFVKLSKDREDRLSHCKNLTCFYLYRKYSRRLGIIPNHVEKVKAFFIFPIRLLLTAKPPKSLYFKNNMF